MYLVRVLERVLRHAPRPLSPNPEIRNRARARNRERAAPVPRWPEQNSCGKIGLLLGAGDQPIEDEHEQEHEHDSPKFGIWV